MEERLGEDGVITLRNRSAYARGGPCAVDAGSGKEKMPILKEKIQLVDVRNRYGSLHGI